MKDPEANTDLRPDGGGQRLQRWAGEFSGAFADLGTFLPLVTAAIAADLFPHERKPITPDRLAFTSGLLNVLLPQFGAFPMCHGAGGLVVQHKFGARTGLAPALFGLTCLALGVFLGGDALALMTLLPLAAIGALLFVAGADLAVSKQLRKTRQDSLVVITLTGLSCVLLNVAVGLLVGLLAEWIRRRLSSSELP